MHILTGIVTQVRAENAAFYPCEFGFCIAQLIIKKEKTRLRYHDFVSTNASSSSEKKLFLDMGDPKTTIGGGGTFSVR